MLSPELVNLQVQEVLDSLDKKAAAPTLTGRLFDIFCDNWGKFITSSTISGSVLLGYSTYNALSEGETAIPGIAKVAVLGVSIASGAAAGFVGGLMASVIFASVGEQVEGIERKIRGRFRL